MSKIYPRLPLSAYHSEQVWKFSSHILKVIGEGLLWNKIYFSNLSKIENWWHDSWISVMILMHADHLKKFCYFHILCTLSSTVFYWYNYWKPIIIFSSRVHFHNRFYSWANRDFVLRISYHSSLISHNISSWGEVSGTEILLVPPIISLAMVLYFLIFRQCQILPRFDLYLLAMILCLFPHLHKQ